ncbi:translocation/assembly module TamB domain-containing protein [Wenyingzhuangia sp. IMCC45533]
MTNKGGQILIKAFHLLKWVFLFVIVVFIITVLAIRSSWGQNFIKNKLADFVTDKIDTEFNIGKLYVSFSGNLIVEDLYLEDQQKDTLLYSHYLEVSTAFLPIITQNKINIKNVTWKGLRANVHTLENDTLYNYSYIPKAFIDNSTKNTQPKDTTANSTTSNIKIGTINISDFLVNYNDANLGVDTQLDLNTLEVRFGKKFSVEKAKFPVKKLTLVGINASYTQSKAFPESEPSENPAPLPEISIDELTFTDINALYQDKTTDVKAEVQLTNFKIENALMALAKNKIDANAISLSDSSIKLQLPEVNPSVEVDTLAPKKDFQFNWPAWQVKIDHIDFVNNQIQLKNKNAGVTPNVFNPQDISVANSNIILDDLVLKNQSVSLKLKEMSFKEQSGFTLNQFGFDVSIDNKKSVLDDLVFVTNHSELKGKLALNYASLNQLINKPETANFELDFPKIEMNLKDGLYFSPELADDQTVAALQKNNFLGVLNVSGKLENIALKKANISWGKKTFVNVYGKLENITNPKRMYVDVPEFKLVTQKEDLASLLDEKKMGIQFPANIELVSKAKGKSDKISTKTSLKTSKGNLLVEGVITNQKIKGFNGVVNLQAFRLGEILNNKDIGTLDFETSIKASGSDANDLSANIKTQFNQLSYKGYNYNPLKFRANIDRGKGMVIASFTDENLDFETQTNIQLDSILSKIKTNINIKGIDFKGLNITQKNIKSRLNITANFKGNANNFVLKANTNNGLFVYDRESIPLSNFEIDALVNQDSTVANIKSKLLNFALKSNTSPQQFSNSIQNHINYYISSEKTAKQQDTISENVLVDATLNFRQSPVIEDVFLEELNRFAPVNLSFSYNQNAKKLEAFFNAPLIEYQESKLENARLNFNTQKDSLKLDLHVDRIKHSVVDIENLNLTGNVIDEVIHLDFSTRDEQSKIININTELTRLDEQVTLRVDPSEIVLNRKLWELPANNAIVFKGEQINTKNFKLFRNNQTLSFNAGLDQNNQNDIVIDFDNFKLSNILSFLNPEKEIANGILSGKVQANHINNNQTLTSDLKVNNLQVFKNTLGDLNLEATSVNNHKVDVNLTLIEKDSVQLLVNGNYDVAKTQTPLNLDVQLKKLSLKKVAGFAPDAISNASGYLSANFKMQGNFSDPQYNGALNLNQVKLKVNMFNTDFSFPEESITVDNSSILLDQFTMLDTEQNKFVIDGSIGTTELSNPTFDLKVHTDNLQVLNSTEKDNDLFYGKLFLNTDVNIKGDMTIPVITGTLRVNKNSNFTYVIPESRIEAVEREGVVLFVNKSVTNDILTSYDNVTETKTGALKGLDIQTVLQIDAGAILNVIVNKSSGDNLRVQGKADLNFGLEPSGRTTLSGVYEVEDGHYEASLYNLVRRKFNIAKGSKITWQGDPIDAKMDIKAIYKVETPASGLMASVTSGLEATALNRFRKKIPFWVYLNLGGELLKPAISFNLDIPEDSRGELGGQVYTQVRQLNNREDELNKQVFSLLVLNQFFPSNKSDGSNGGSLSIARNNVNRVLSNQLNNYSSKLVGNTGIELGFELDSYTDYTSEGQQDNTQLNVSAQKKLFNDRLTVQVGSGFELENGNQNSNGRTPIIGNVNIEYALTENRRYRLRGFRKNEFQSVIDGQVIVTGISFLFNREFNKFKQLFNKEVAKSNKDKQE